MAINRIKLIRIYGPELSARLFFIPILLFDMVRKEMFKATMLANRIAGMIIKFWGNIEVKTKATPL